MTGAMRLVVAVMAGLAAAACESGTDGGLPPGPAALEVGWTTPYADDGAVLLVLWGPLPATATAYAAAPGLEVHSTIRADSLFIAVFGDLAAGPLVRVLVPDGSVLPRINMRIEEAASRANAQRDAVSDYTLTLSRIDP